jgi:hydroxypyruvate isomerase
MLNRRQFLAVSGLGLASLASGWGRSEIDSTWLTYAPDVELFWARLPFLERLQKLSEAGFSRYEFGRWKTKDFSAIMKRDEELGLQAAIFNGCPALKGLKWKDMLIKSVEDSAELAPKLGSTRLSLIAPDRDDKLDRADQVDDLVDALKEAVEKLAEFEGTLILEATRPPANRPPSLVTTTEEAASVVKAVGSDKVKFAFTIDPAAIVDGKVPDLIQKHKAQAGYYRLGDFAPPAGPNEANYARVLRAIHDAGYEDPIGLALAAKVDPMAAIESIRKLDAAAKGL